MCTTAIEAFGQSTQRQIRAGVPSLVNSNLQRACVRSLSCRQLRVCEACHVNVCSKLVNVKIKRGSASIRSTFVGRRTFENWVRLTGYRLPFEAPSSPANSGSTVVIRWTRINRSLHCICWLLHSVPQALANHRHYPVLCQVGVAGTRSG